MKADDKGRRSILPGWNEFGAPAKSDALILHSVWLSAGRPSTGTLHQIMCWTRNKYHYATRKIKRLAASVKARDLLKATENGDAALMTEMKRTLMKKNLGQSVPESLEGKVTHDSILDKF